MYIDVPINVSINIFNDNMSSILSMKFNRDIFLKALNIGYFNI